MVLRPQRVSVSPVCLVPGMRAVRVLPAESWFGIRSVFFGGRFLRFLAHFLIAGEKKEYTPTRGIC